MPQIVGKKKGVRQLAESGSLRPLFTKSTLVQNWLASGEALAIYNLIIDQRSHQPTLNGAIWLQEANIKAEEIYMFNK